MIRNEYLRFMQTLKGEKVPEGVRKIANLVLVHLDTIQPLTTYQGQRVKKFVSLAQREWATLLTEIIASPDNTEKNTTGISRLKALQVGPFRGFARQEDFDLNYPLVLIYGPNGSGKTSFCEALEYSLLGNVAEAESKRYRAQDYLKNAHIGQFVKPTIEAVNEYGDTLSVAANEAQYRFCFVEKNRIDSFSRIAAQLPAKQTELISTLFGLDSFNDFVRNFTSIIDERYIDIYGLKSIELNQKRQALAGYQQTLKDSKEAFMEFEKQENALAHQYKEGITFSQLVAMLGSVESPGEISILEAELQQPLGLKTGLTVLALESQQQSIIKNHSLLSEKEKTLAEASESLSFRQLYEAVLSLGVISQNECPACKTPLEQVSKNPFELAPQELSKLEHLAQLQKERDQIQTEISHALKSIYQAIKVCTERLGTADSPNALHSVLVRQEYEIDIIWWNSLFDLGNDGYTPWQHLLAQVQQLEQMDVAIEQSQLIRSQKQQRLNHLRELDKKITILQAKRKAMNDSVLKANQEIANFDEANKMLIAEVELEKKLVETNKEIARCYSTFVDRLERYRDALPRQLVADLGDTVIELYNAFNRNDARKDLLAGIKLPVAQGEMIEVAFQSNPDHYYDALHILSEGHVRCIGLAILMAKNIKENCPVLIFDDPVNAIDDDHRESIRRTLFEDNYFSEKQIILTCHGEEFFKDIQNLLGAARAKQSQTLTFLPQLDEQHIHIDFNCTPRNYILAAQEHINKLEMREALAKSRQALESLTKGKLWRYVNKHGDGMLSITMRSATAPIELRNLTEQLRSKLLKSDFTHQLKNAVLTPIETLLGISGNSREWRYLNKGTHEEIDREEFDRSTVTNIVCALADIDAALSN